MNRAKAVRFLILAGVMAATFAGAPPQCTSNVFENACGCSGNLNQYTDGQGFHHAVVNVWCSGASYVFVDVRKVSYSGIDDSLDTCGFDMPGNYGARTCDVTNYYWGNTNYYEVYVGIDAGACTAPVYIYQGT